MYSHEDVEAGVGHSVDSGEEMGYRRVTSSIDCSSTMCETNSKHNASC